MSLNRPFSGETIRVKEIRKKMPSESEGDNGWLHLYIRNMTISGSENGWLCESCEFERRKQ
jgi:hypothetical protein